MQDWFRPLAVLPSSGPAVGRVERLAQHLLLLGAFVIPFSTALANFFVGLTLIAFVLALLLDRSLAQPLRKPAPLLALALLALVLAGAAWSIAPPDEVRDGMRKYAKLLVLPIAACLCWRAPALPARVLRWSLAGCAFLATAIYLVWLDMMPTSSLGWWRVGDMSDPFVFRNHITNGILLSFASCACFLLATWHRTAGARLAAVAAGIYLCAPILSGNGRTGYVGVAVGLFVLFLLRSRVTLARTAAAAAGIVLLFGLVYQVSPNFKTRTDLLIHEVQAKDPTTPNGLRLSYMRAAGAALLQRPLLGHGTGSFAEVFEEEARTTLTALPELTTARHQPHSEPLLLAVQLGLPGLFLFAALVLTLVKAALARREPGFDALALLVAVYGVASLFNSLLWDPTEAYWFLLLAGALYAHCVQRHEATMSAA